MSNYPPGVTGNEYEIAGGEETEDTILLASLLQPRLDSGRLQNH